MRTVAIPNSPPMELTHLLLDVNGTLTDHGELVEGVAAQLADLKEDFEIHLLSADTFGSLTRVAKTLGVAAVVVGDGSEKAEFARRIGSRVCVAIGNGANDAPMLREVALGIAVIQSEGAAATTLAAADVVCRSINEALTLLLDDRALVATLRA